MSHMICNACGRHIHYCDCRNSNTRRVVPLRLTPKKVIMNKKKYCVICGGRMCSSRNIINGEWVHVKCQYKYLHRDRRKLK